ncbi:MAG: phage terminase large subunit family protein [Bradyrhizobium sp.]|uniref:phage terminase large subunit family protein n=1 Tax=Bradyrhizobium sp. TaxID=376 RepID=UPI003D13939B
MIQTAHTARQILLAAAIRAVRPKARLTVSEWADANRILSVEGSAEVGRWKTARTPYLREIMDQLSEDSPAQLVVFRKCSQIGGTEAGSNWLGYIIDHAKGPVAVVMPTEKSLTDWMSQKFEPMAESTPAVRDALAGKASGDNNAARKKFAGGILYAKTAGSTAELKSTTLRYALADEVDEYDWTTTQGDPLGLLEVRLTTYAHSRKMFVPSTPTTRDASRIDELYERGDQRHFHVPCPHCGEFQHLKWGNLMFKRAEGSRRRITDVWYACEHCGCEIQEYHKTDMLARGRWIADAPDAPYPSYHINALYAPVGLGLTWGELAMEWLEAQEDTAKLMRFMNTRLGESWADRSGDIKANALMSRAEPYALRTVPPGCLVITVGVDVQSGAQARLEIQVLGHGKGERTWTLDYHVLSGNPEDDHLWDALADYVNGIQFTNARGHILRSEACGIDTGGHHTHAVYAFVRAGRVRRPMALKGASTPGRPILCKPSHQDVNWRGKTIKRGVALYTVGTDTAKHALYNRLHGDAERAPEDRKVRFSQELDEAYYNGLVSETYNPRRNRWELKKGKRNEPLDTWVYAVAASHHPELYVHKWKAADWERRAAMLEPVEVEEGAAPGAPAPPVPPPATPPARGRRQLSEGVRR